ncbi:MAG TPA: hypothetical protein VGJ95_21805 [Pseudonocardiaceae bacterium]|jgi:cobalamin synthase
MLRTTLVVIHAAAGIIGLVAGLVAFRPPERSDRSRRLGAYVACLAILLLTLVTLIGVDWPQLDVTARIAFVALTGLGVVMMYRIIRAWREATARSGGWPARYIGHVYFTYVSLWIGFLVLPALNLPYPQFSVPVLAVIVLLLGNLLVTRFKKRVLPP